MYYYRFFLYYVFTAARNSSDNASLGYHSANSGRRDSTGTMSSYLSSMRSDGSPFPLASNLSSGGSSRRSSGAGSALSSSALSSGLSSRASPFEYDMSGEIFLIFSCNKLEIVFLSPPVRIARWAHMRRFPSVCPSVCLSVCDKYQTR